MDLPGILRIEVQSHPDPWTGQGFLEEMAGGDGSRHLLVMTPEESPGEVLAYSCFHYLWDHVYVLNLTVSPKERGRGLGRLMLRWVIRWATGAGCERVVLDVRKDNAPARGLYRKEGFRELGEFRAADGHSTIRMYRPLARDAHSSRPAG